MKQQQKRRRRWRRRRSRRRTKRRSKGRTTIQQDRVNRTDNSVSDRAEEFAFLCSLGRCGSC